MLLRYARTRIPRFFAALLVAIATALGAVPSIANAQGSCPDNYMAAGCGDFAAPPISEPTAKLEGGPWQAGTLCSTACYDLPHGEFVVNATGNPYTASCGRMINASDVYTITGLPAGPPLSFAAELWVSGQINEAASFFALLGGPGGDDSRNTTTAGFNEFALHLPLTQAPGQPFTLNVRLEAYGFYPGGDARALGTLVFMGLPHGAVVQSCQNYEIPVPATASTWGGVKAIYRN